MIFDPKYKAFYNIMSMKLSKCYEKQKKQLD